MTPMPPFARPKPRMELCLSSLMSTDREIAVQGESNL